MPKVSVVMPVYNGEKYLKEAIDSILNQTFKDVEFIIVNDGSCDRSEEIIKEYAAVDNRIKLINNASNLGISGATNVGIDSATGDYIALMDQDDISMPERFEKEVNFLKENSEISVVGGNASRLDEEGNIQNRKPVTNSPSILRWVLLFKNEIQNPSVMMRKELFNVYKFRYENYEPSQDYALWCKLNKSFWFANLPDIFLLSRVHHDNASKLLQDVREENLLRIKRNMIHDYFNITPDDRILSGLSKHEVINNLKDAREVISMIIDWQQRANGWCRSRSDKRYIAGLTARKIRDIWKIRGKHVSLMPYIIYSLILGV